MSMTQALQSYKKTENDYVKGIESPHGRIQLVFDTILLNLDNLVEIHPKTDFTSFGKCVNGLKILGNSLDIKNGGELASQLVEIYDYCLRELRKYLTDKKIENISEIHAIISNLSDAWQEINPQGN